jgi:two-component system, sensor histidine kinase and response regulator
MEPTDKPAGLIDWSAALEATGDDEVLLAELIEVFLSEAPTLLKNIRTALDEGDGPLLRRAAHTLKGSLRIFGAAQGVELAQQLETRGQKDALDGAAPVLDELERYMARFVEELKSRYDG